MCLYTKNAVNFISFIITIITFIFLNELFSQINFKKIKNENVISEEINIIQEENTKENIMSNNEEVIEEKVVDEFKESAYAWAINIPNIGLIAPIEESVEKEVMDRSVGHFSNTSIWNGNIGLGAHNRGYPVNYFSDIKKLKKGDIIRYKYNGEIRQYVVDNIVIIKDTDWSYLKETEENKITLITCVENEPNYRRCIQGVEK